MWKLVCSSARVYVSRDLFNSLKSVIDVDNRLALLLNHESVKQSSVDHIYASELNSASEGIRGRLMNMFYVLYDDAFIEKAFKWSLRVKCSEQSILQQHSFTSD